MPARLSPGFDKGAATSNESSSQAHPLPLPFLSSFQVPFEEDERDPKTWFLDLDYVEGMWEMFRKVNGQFSPRLPAHLFPLTQLLISWTTAKERPIGFYHTGPTLRSSDLEISELFKRFVPKPVSSTSPSLCCASPELTLPLSLRLR